MNAALFLALFDGLEAAVTIYNKMAPAAVRVRQMVEEGREPTPEEWEELIADGQADFDAIMNG